MELIPSPMKMLGDQIIADKYLRGLMLEMREAMMTGKSLGHTRIIFRFQISDALDIPAKNKIFEKHDILVQYLKRKKYKVKYRDNKMAIWINWK